jgi:branched-chain amino acid aminotransferase
MNCISLNGKIIAADQPALLASNKGYRYGDGLFETMKIVNGQILLENYHFERLFSGISLLKYGASKLFTPQKIKNEILALCKKNECLELARVRLSVFRSNGGLYDANGDLQYLIECWPLEKSINKLNENGLIIDIYPDAVKNCDQFSNLKSANFLPYTMAALFAKENKLNDCLVLNNFGRIADATIANIFVIKGGAISTPALQEGCIKGVMRRHLIEKLPAMGYKLQEGELTISDLEKADEVFLSNAIYGIRWVKQFGNKMYSNSTVKNIYLKALSNY